MSDSNLDTSTQEARITNPLDKEAIRKSIRFLHLGRKIRGYRKRKPEMTSEKVAIGANIDKARYVRIESGQVMPTREEIERICRHLDVDSSSLFRAAEFALHQANKNFLEAMPVKNGALKYSKQWELAAAEFKKSCLEKYSDDEDIEENIDRIIVNLEKDISKVSKLPILPVAFHTILMTLAEHKTKTYLHEISDESLGGSLSEFIALDPYFGPFITFEANRVYFQDHSSMGIIDCMNRLTIEQFKVLLYGAISNAGIYTYTDGLGNLQQYHEFSKLTALTALKLKPHLPNNVDFDHLYLCSLLQGLGTHVFYTILKPVMMNHKMLDQLQKNDKLRRLKSKKAYDELDEERLELINYELHPIVSGMVAANWGFADEIVMTLINHHARAGESVTPLCATLKLINDIVDCDFPTYNRDDLDVLLSKYPQVQISTDAIFKVTTEMQRLRDRMIEASSQVTQRSEKVSKVISKRIKQFNERNKVRELSNVVFYPQPKASDFRFDAEVLENLAIECYPLLLSFITGMTQLRLDEGIEQYLRRMQNIQLVLACVSDNDPKALADKFKIDVNQIKTRLLELMKM